MSSASRTRSDMSKSAQTIPIRCWERWEDIFRERRE
jgi:hypothetical protein